MRIVIITQNEPFYLAKNLNYLIKFLPKHSEVVACVVNDVSPFGKKETFFNKAINTYKIFGIKFFLHYGIKFVMSKFNKLNKINYVLKSFNIPKIKLVKNINHEDSVNKISSYKPDLLISILGNQIFKEQIFNLAPKGCLNLHTALLPKYRGLMPTFWVLKNNETHTGVSVFFVDKGIDSGPIIVQESLKIGNRTQEQLIIETKKIGMNCILKSIDLINNNNFQLIENNPEEKSYYSFPTKNDVRIFKKLGKRFF